MSMARILAALLMLCCASGPLSAEDMPQLMLEAGGHMNDITGLALTSDGRLLVSAGDDKVIRVWDWEAAKTIRIIRGQIAAGSEGKIFALALSPDGRWLAAGGWMKVPQESGHVIRLYDFATGKLVALLRGHTNVVRSLAFSPDSRLLISGQRGYAILWDVEHQEVIHRLKGQEQIEIDAVAFTPDGQRAITGSDDATLRLWRVSNADLIAEMTGHEAPIGRALAVRSSDGMIASGDETGKIRLWDGKTGEYLRTLANQKGSVGPLSFAPNGMWLLSTTQRGEGGASQWPGHVWDVASGREIVTYTKHDNILFAGAVSPNGRLVATSGGDNNEIHIWDPNTGETRRVLRSVGTGIWAAAFSSDGHRIAWGTTHSRALTMQFRLPTETQGLGKPEPIDKELAKDFLRASTTYNTYTLSTRPGGRPTREKAILDIQKDRRTLVSIERDSTTGMQHLSFSFTPDGKSIVSGGAHGRISAYDLMGKRLGDFVGHEHESEVWAVTPSPDGRLLLSSSDDQTIRLWNLTTRELIVTFFCSRDREWVMWTPQGYYASSPAGDRLVGWQINKGPDQAADYVTGNQLRTHFYRPDIVDRAIILASANAAVGQARGTDFSLTDLLKRRPPAFDIVSPEHGSRAVATPVEIRLRLESNPDAIEAIDVLVNGRQVTTPAFRNATARLAASGPPERRIDVPLEQGENKIHVVARNKIGQTVRDFVLFHDKPGLLDSRGTLYVLAIGVDKYPNLPSICGPNGNQTCDLRYAGQDARAFRDVLVKQAGPLYKNIKTLLLARDGDKPPTRANIEDALGEMLGKAGPEDTTVLFIAGHGVNDGQSTEYLFMPEEAEFLIAGWRKSTVLPWVVFQNALHHTQGRRLMFVDTCHSGGAYNSRLVNDAANADIVVFSATDPQTLSWEFDHLAHGAFTYALIQGIEGKARRNDGSVTLFGLGEFISQEVASLTSDKQQPTFHMSGAKNFMLAKQ